MEKILLIITIICIFSNAAFAAIPSSQQLSAIEKQIFGYEYQSENEAKRLNRIETYLYGKISNKVISARINEINNNLGIAVNTQTAKTNPAAPLNKNKLPQYEKEDPSVNYPIVNNIEEKVLKKTFKTENIYARLDRLEKSVFNEITKDSLNNRVDKLRMAVLNQSNDELVENSDNNEYLSDNFDNNNLSKTWNKKSDDNSFLTQSKNKENYMNRELSAIEKTVLKQTFETENVTNRLTRLESNVFQRNFINESENARLDRLAAVVTAKKTSTQYDNNKLMKGLATGAQIGGILLMILAMIL